MQPPSVETVKRFHLFGYPIAHSAAPDFHNLCFKKLGLPNQFTGWSTSRIDKEMMDEIRSLECGGAAVTMPLKTEILQYLDELAPASQATKACNTIIKVTGNDGSYKLVGTNTDVLGIRNSILRTLKTQHKVGYNFSTHQKFPKAFASGLVIGGGATTRSAVYALSTLGLCPIFLVNRNDEEVQSVIDCFMELSTETMGYNHLELIHLRSVEDVDRYLGSQELKGEKPGIAMAVGAIPAIAPVTPAERLVYTIVVHILTIPYHHVEFDTSNLNVLPLPTKRIYLDMAYKPRLTPMLRIASALGWEDVGGIQAMIEQGLSQQRMWKAGSASDEEASRHLLPESVEREVRISVEVMQDVIVVSDEIDRSLVVL